MVKAIELRSDVASSQLRAAAAACQDCAEARRLFAIAAILDGASRREAAEIGAVTPQVVRDWVIRFNAEGLSGLRTAKPPGKVAILNDEHRRALVERMTAASGETAGNRQIDLVQWLDATFGLQVSRQTLSRELRALGLSRAPARRPGPDPYADGGKPVRIPARAGGFRLGPGRRNQRP